MTLQQITKRNSGQLIDRNIRTSECFPTSKKCGIQKFCRIYLIHKTLSVYPYTEEKPTFPLYSLGRYVRQHGHAPCLIYPLVQVDNWYQEF